MSTRARNGDAGNATSGAGQPLPVATELTIYIVEDSQPVRERLVEAVRDIPNARVVGQAEAINEALEGVRKEQPRVLILDIQLRGGSGIRLLKQMRAAGVNRPEIVIVVTNYPTADYRKASQDCGADHFFNKASEFDKVRDVLMEHASATRLAPSVRGRPRSDGYRCREFALLPAVAAGKILHLTLRLLAFPSVAFLQLAGEDFRVAFDLVDFVVGQFAPLLLDLALQLFEVA